MSFEPIFNAPSELSVLDKIISTRDLRIALEDNDMGILQPLIDLILLDAANKKTDSLAFPFLVEIGRAHV